MPNKYLGIARAVKSLPPSLSRFELTINLCGDKGKHAQLPYFF